MSSLCPSLHFFTKRNDREKKKRKEKKERRNIHRNILACKIAMIMKFSTHSRQYIYLLQKPFLLVKINMRIDNYEINMQCKGVIVAIIKQH